MTNNQMMKNCRWYAWDSNRGLHCTRQQMEGTDESNVKCNPPLIFPISVFQKSLYIITYDAIPGQTFFMKTFKFDGINGKGHSLFDRYLYDMNLLD